MQTKTINRNDYTGNQVTAIISDRKNNATEYDTGIHGVWTVTFTVDDKEFYLVGLGKQTERQYSLYELETTNCVAQGFEFEDGDVVMDSNGLQRDGTGEDAALDAAIQIICNVY